MPSFIYYLCHYFMYYYIYLHYITYSTFLVLFMSLFYVFAKPEMVISCSDIILSLYRSSTERFRERPNVRFFLTPLGPSDYSCGRNRTISRQNGIATQTVQRHELHVAKSFSRLTI